MSFQAKHFLCSLVVFSLFLNMQGFDWNVWISMAERDKNFRSQFRIDILKRKSNQRNSAAKNSVAESHFISFQVARCSHNSKRKEMHTNKSWLQTDISKRWIGDGTATSIIFLLHIIDMSPFCSLFVVIDCYWNRFRRCIVTPASVTPSISLWFVSCCWKTNRSR